VWLGQGGSTFLFGGIALYDRDLELLDLEAQESLSSSSASSSRRARCSLTLTASRGVFTLKRRPLDVALPLGDGVDDNPLHIVGDYRSPVMNMSPHMLPLLCCVTALHCCITGTLGDRVVGLCISLAAIGVLWHAAVSASPLDCNAVLLELLGYLISVRIQLQVLVTTSVKVSTAVFNAYSNETTRIHRLSKALFKRRDTSCSLGRYESSNMFIRTKRPMIYSNIWPCSG
jgi:hypothetical protein